MSSEHKHERLETLQKSYRRAWITYAAEVDFLQSAIVDNAGEDILVGARERVEHAASEYRITRDEMALFLLDEQSLRPEHLAESEREPQFAVCRTA